MLHELFEFGDSELFLRKYREVVLKIILFRTDVPNNRRKTLSLLAAV
jgi:hypothetical protein